MNTLNGYSKSTLTDKYVLTAAGGHRYIYDSEFIIGTQTAATGSWTGVSIDSELYDGKQISYWLPFKGSGNATLNLTLAGGSTTGAINCYYGGTSRLTTQYGAGNIIRLVYRKNVTIGNTTYTGWWADANYVDGNTYTSAWCSTAAATAAKTAFCSNYTLLAKSYIHILIRYTNTATEAITMNINSTGAKPIYINGAASSASNYNLLAGTYIVYYDGTNFYFRTDGTIPGIVEQSLISNTTNSLKISELSRTNFDFLPHSYGEGLTSWYTAADTPSGTCSGLTLKHSNYFVWQLSSDCKISTTDYNKNNLYFRSGGLNSTDTLIWGDWKTILDSHNWTDYIDLTKFYWANIPISTESNDATTPQVLYLYATNGINTSYIRSNNSMSISSAYNITLSANDSSVIKIADTFINPLKDDTVNLGTAYDRWSAIHTKSLTTESLNYRCKGSSEYPKMYFYNNTWTYLGFFGMNSEKKFVIADQSGYSSNYVLHSGNSSVSGDGTYITVKINDVTKTLTIPTASALLYWADLLISNLPSTTITPTFSSIVLGTDTYNYIKCGTPNSGDDNSLAFVFRGRSTNISNASFIMNYEELYPARDVRYSLGTSSLRWSSVYTYSTYTWAIYCKPSNYNNYIATLLANKDSNGDYYGTLSLGYILDSSYGILSIYGKSLGCARVCYKNTTSNSNLYLPTINLNIPLGTLLYHEDGKQVGNATTPIYINSDGQAVACNPYPTASGLSLEKTLGINGLDYVFHAPNSDVTTSIYAPTTVGTSGYILQSTGSGTPSWTSRLSYDYPGIIWIGYIYRTSRSYTTWYVSKQGGSATVSMYISSPTSSNNYQVALQSSTHNILGGMCSIQAQWNAGKEGGQSTEGPLYAWSTVNVEKIEEAGTEIFVTTAHNGYFYIKALRADDDDNTSYYFDGLAYTGLGRNTNSLPLARINVILFGY